MAERFGKRDEVALRVDHDLLDELRALLQKPAEKMRLPRPAVALHEQTGGQQFLDVDGNLGPAGSGADHD